MSHRFQALFATNKPLIACVHLLPLPGAPLYDGDLSRVFDQAAHEIDIFVKNGADAIIIENFRDKPFYPTNVPVETVAALSAISRELINKVNIPVGINVLRNDAEAAVAIATATQANFIRVNTHMGAVVSEQGIIQGLSHKTLRLRSHLKSDIAIFADIGVKHAAPLADRGLAIEAKDLQHRGLVDALIVSGALTGLETSTADIQVVKDNAQLPILIGSGATPENIEKSIGLVNGYIVGSYFKKDGIGNNFVDEKRVQNFIDAMKGLDSNRAN